MLNITNQAGEINISQNVFANIVGNVIIINIAMISLYKIGHVCNKITSIRVVPPYK